MKAIKWREMQSDELEQKVKELTEELFTVQPEAPSGHGGREEPGAGGPSAARSGQGEDGPAGA